MPTGDVWRSQWLFGGSQFGPWPSELAVCQTLRNSLAPTLPTSNDEIQLERVTAQYVVPSVTCVDE